MTGSMSAIPNHDLPANPKLLSKQISAAQAKLKLMPVDANAQQQHHQHHHQANAGDPPPPAAIQAETPQKPYTDAKKAMKLSLAKKKAKADASAKKRSQQNEPQVSTGNAIFDEDDQLPDTRELDEEFFEEHGDYASFLSSLEVGSFTDGSTGPTCC